MKIVFMGSPQFSIPALSVLYNSMHQILAVYTKEPKPAGRNQKISKTPVNIISEENGLKVFTPKSFRNLRVQEEFVQMHPDIGVVVAYGLILPKEILSAPKYGFINAHPSLLPKWRGASPIQHALLNNEHYTGVTIIQLNEVLDAGPILLQDSIYIEETDNYSTLHDKLSVLGGKMILRAINNIDKLAKQEQDENLSSYADKIIDYNINFNDNAIKVCKFIKALYPKAFFTLNGKRIRILDAGYYCDDSLRVIPSAIINKNLHIKCGESSVLTPKIVQLEGRKPCSVEEFMRGFLL